MKETHLREGAQTIKLGLIKVTRDLFPDDLLKTSYSILEGVFCNLAHSSLSVREVKQIEFKLREWVLQNNSIQLLGHHDGYYHYQVDDMLIKAVYPAHTHPQAADDFIMFPFSYGFIIYFGDQNRYFEPPYLLSATYEKSQRWLRDINIEFVSDVNDYIRSGQSLKLLSIAEAVHEKILSDIADSILRQRRALRMLLIAGPSSSGKTSFAQRISTQLHINGLKTVALSLDDYYLDREQMPRDEDGNIDFDSLYALDLPLLQKHLAQLINGETIESPIHDFIRSGRAKETKTMHVSPSEILIIEGIHALNPELTLNINRSLLFKVYVSALGGLNFDLCNRVPTTEMRLIRRLVRDDRYRGSHPEETFGMWASVRRGEEQNIFYFQEDSDVMFNSNILYEMNAMRPYAEITLSKVRDDSPFYETKERLMNLLSFFEPMDVAKVPYNSILREFIGGSIYFSY